MNRKIALLLSLVVSGPLLAQADNRSALNQDEATRARMELTKDQLDFHKMVDRASEVYSAIAKGPHGEVPSSVLKKAQCIAVLPNVMTKDESHRTVLVTQLN